jgi:hypothetical protein
MSGHFPLILSLSKDERDDAAAPAPDGGPT